MQASRVLHSVEAIFGGRDASKVHRSRLPTVFSTAPGANLMSSAQAYGRRSLRTARVPITVTSAANNPSSSAAQGAHDSAPDNSSRTRPQRICIMVEPSPFTYVCGYMNRYRNTIRFLVEHGCEVLVVTPGKGVCIPGCDDSAFVDQPKEYLGAKIVSAYSFSCPWAFKPDIIHSSSPGIMWFAALLYSRMLKAPLVYSYHTHVPEYMPRYGITWLVSAMWAVIRFFHNAAHLTLATSSVLAEELANYRAAPRHMIDVWKKGVCSDTFHPKFTCNAMRAQLTDGHPEAPLLLSVGRLGSEKNLDFLKGVLERVPGARLAFVGDGPAREQLKEHFKDTNTVFAGMLHGEDLSAAYASADVFVMPSESETLGFVVLEAMASGVPVVAVRAGGIPDILTKQGVTGYLYDSGDVESAAAHVSTLLKDEELRCRVGVAGREEVGLWDWSAATLHLLEVQYPAAMAAAALYYGKALSNTVGGRPPAAGDVAPTPAFA